MCYALEIETTLMPLQPITTKRIYLQIAEQVARAIREGEYPVGTTLPSERVLAEQLGVSRASVREALIALQLMGLVDIRPGGGAFVVATTSKGVSSDELGREISAFELLHARQIIESDVIALAAEMASRDDVRQLTMLVDLMAREIRDESPTEEGDRRFHMYLATITGNAVLSMIVRQLWDLRQDHLWDVLHRRAFGREHREAYLADHRRMLVCIEEHDAKGARREMWEHLKRLEGYFLTS